MATESYVISSQIYYDTFNTCYKRILTVDRMPTGTLATITRRIQNNKLSEFKNRRRAVQSAASCAPSSPSHRGDFLS